MKRFFLFKRKEIDVSSLEASDTGEGLDVLAISVDHLSFMTASLGRVTIVFNDATIYEESNLLDGESFRKTSVDVACEEGNEFALIESIMNFISSDRVSSSVMRFDAIQGKTNVREAKIQQFSDVSSKVRQQPIVRNTGKISKKTFINGTSGTALGTDTIIDKIDFGSVDNVPLVDYNQENFTLSGTEVTAWANDSNATGGSTYNLTNQKPGAAPTIDVQEAGRLVSGFKTRAAEFQNARGFNVANDISIEGPFTLYTVFGANPSYQTSGNFNVRMYGSQPSFFLRTVDQATSTTNKIIFEDENSFFDVGLGDLLYNGSGYTNLLGVVTALNPDGDNTKEVQISSSNTIVDDDLIRFEVTAKRELERTCHGFQDYPTVGSVLSFDLAFNNNTSETIKFTPKGFFDYETPEEERNTCYVLVMRRDKDNNLFFYDRTGTLIHTELFDKSLKNTKGALKISNIGGHQQAKVGYYMPRFGVIESDIGGNNASELAKDLFNRYNP